MNLDFTTPLDETRTSSFIGPSSANLKYAEVALHYVHWVHIDENLLALEECLTNLCQPHRGSRVHLFIESFGSTAAERHSYAAEIETVANKATPAWIRDFAKQIDAVSSTATDSPNILNWNLLAITLWNIRRATCVNFKITLIDVDESHEAVALDKAAIQNELRIVELESKAVSSQAVEQYLTALKDMTEHSGRSYHLRDKEVCAQMNHWCDVLPTSAPKIVLSGTLHLAQSRGIPSRTRHREFISVPVGIAEKVSPQVLRTHAPRIADQKILKVANGIALQRHDLIDILLERMFTDCIMTLKGPFGDNIPIDLAPYMSRNILTRAISIFVNTLAFETKLKIIDAIVPEVGDTLFQRAGKFLGLASGMGMRASNPTLESRFAQGGAAALCSIIGLSGKGNDGTVDVCELFRRFFTRTIGVKF